MPDDIKKLMSNLRVSETVTLELIEPHHAAGLLKLIDKQRPYLKQWLPWVDNMQKPDDAQRYIEACTLRQEAGNEYGYMLMVNGEAAGRVGIYKLDYYNGIGEIGYWISEDLQGKGIMTAACKILVQYAFTTLQINRIEIRCVEHNLKSAAIPERLGFKYEGLLRNAEKLPTGFVNLKVYSLLQNEWSS